MGTPIKTIKKLENLSISESINFILAKYENHHSLNLFLDELETFIDDEIVSICLKYENNDFLKIIENFRKRNLLNSITFRANKPIPLIQMYENWIDVNPNVLMPYVDLGLKRGYKEIDEYKIMINPDPNLINKSKDGEQYFFINKDVLQIKDRNGNSILYKGGFEQFELEKETHSLIRLSNIFFELKNIVRELFKSSIPNDPEPIDLSETKGTEKVIFLYKLGVLDFLRTKIPFTVSINQLASYLSAITGEKPETIQSYINPLISSETSQKNNPLTKESKVKKVEQTLIKMGFEADELTD